MRISKLSGVDVAPLCPICKVACRSEDLAQHVRTHYAATTSVWTPSVDLTDGDFEYVTPDPSPWPDRVAPWGSVAYAPVFRPTPEEFRDPLAYISSLSEIGRRFGLCKIVPPQGMAGSDTEWNLPKTPTPPSIDTNRLAFRTKVQNIHQLKHRASRAEAFHASYCRWLEAKERPVPSVGIDDIPVDLWGLFCSVVSLYGALKTSLQRPVVDWGAVLRKYMSWSVLSGGAMVRKWGTWDSGRCSAETEAVFVRRASALREIFVQHLQDYEREAATNPDMGYTGMPTENIVGFGYSQGPIQTLARFAAKANELKKKWLLEGCRVEELERVYWSLVENAESRLVVEYGNDLSVLQYGSGFPSDSVNPVSKNPWNLNILPKLPTSLFHHCKEAIHGVTDPMLYFGMLFTSFAWHVEDQYLYSINYHHGGAPKVWYGVGSDHAANLEAVMKSELPELFSEHPDILHQLVTAISPGDLRRNNVPVCKAVQEPGEFVVTFPRGFHGGFNTGFNLAEAVNFAMPDWIPFGVDALSNYRQIHRAAAFSHEELILTCARSFPVTQVSVHLLHELYRLTTQYNAAREAARTFGIRKFMRMAEVSDVPRCMVCNCDCYFAFARCVCSPLKQCCLACVKDVDWCERKCPGLYMVERVPISTLESLIAKLECRVEIVEHCRMRGCSGCSAQIAKIPPPKTSRGRSGRSGDSHKVVYTVTPASVRRKLARKLNWAEDVSATHEAVLRNAASRGGRRRGVFVFAEDDVEEESTTAAGSSSSGGTASTVGFVCQYNDTSDNSNFGVFDATESLKLRASDGSTMSSGSSVGAGAGAGIGALLQQGEELLNDDDAKQFGDSENVEEDPVTGKRILILRVVDQRRSDAAQKRRMISK